jgi:hypothetical protein
MRCRSSTGYLASHVKTTIAFMPNKPGDQEEKEAVKALLDFAAQLF